MNKVILLDLDDTLISTKKRHYFVITEFYKRYYNEEFSLTLEQYVEKRNKNIHNQELLKTQTKEAIDEFKIFWLENIESIEALKNDTLIINLELLLHFKNTHFIDFEILSFRSNSENALKQMNWLEIDKHIKNFHFINHQNENKATKIEEIKCCNKIVCFIGDEEKDELASKQCEIKFIPVNTGWISKINSNKSTIDINEILIRI